MPWVTISDEARIALMVANEIEGLNTVNYQFKPTPEGDWLMNLRLETLERLLSLRGPDESLSDLIIHLCRSHMAAKLN